MDSAQNNLFYPPLKQALTPSGFEIYSPAMTWISMARIFNRDLLDILEEKIFISTASTSWQPTFNQNAFKSRLFVFLNCAPLEKFAHNQQNVHTLVWTYL